LYSGIAVAAGLPPGKCGPHTLKHSIVSHLIAANTNIAIVKAAVGHKSLSSTMEYIHTSDAQVSEAVAIAMMKTF
jgi:site-specific recombinase XerD